MTDRPRVDILVLSHNALDATKRFVQALYANTTGFDLYWLDNGSSDGTVEWFMRQIEAGYSGGIPTSPDSNVYFRTSKENLGVIGGRNELYRVWREGKDVGCSNADYICFLDNDQFVQPGWLEHHFRFIEQGCDLVGVEAWQMNPKTYIPIRQIKHFQQAFNYVGCGGMLMHGTVPDRVGGLFDTRFNPAYFEDPDFCWRAHAAGLRVGWDYSPKIFHLAHQTLRTDGPWMKQFLSSRDKLLEKWEGNPPPIFRQAALEITEKAA
jgi:GT2 family glycosyltransferase